ncbi:MAG TPA: GDSL-type esterase/lipase family protein [Xanthobacteraceae bacterium]|nr:GDSL-type esterase/lipase family protein [Xanthobacteraceae bacterium]
MKFFTTLFAVIALMNGFAFAAQECDVPASLLSSENEILRVAAEVKNKHRLDIAVVGTGSSALPGPDGQNFAYPARLQEALRQVLPGTEIKVVSQIQARQTTADMAAGMKKILADDKPALVIWQAGTFDAVSGIEPDEFSTSLIAGVDAIIAAGADVVLVNMQYSPRTEALLNVSSYADVMRWVAQEHGALLFDRLAIMRYWNDQGIFDLYAATKKSDMARRVHDCIGRALASQIVEAAHLKP